MGSSGVAVRSLIRYYQINRVFPAAFTGLSHVKVESLPESTVLLSVESENEIAGLSKQTAFKPTVGRIVPAWE